MCLLLLVTFALRSLAAASANPTDLYGLSDGLDTPATHFYERFRGEGRSLAEQLLNGIPYLIKTFAKRWNDSPEKMGYFRRAAPPVWGRQTAASPNDLRIGVVGDLMWIRNHWDHFLDPQVRDDLHQFDVVLGNLETPVDESSSVPSLLPDAATYNARPGLVDSFSKNGKSPFTVLTFANNHTFDRGDTGALKTQQFLESRNIRIAGIAPARQKPDQDPVITWIEAKGARIGLYSATWGVNDDDQLASTSMHVEILPGFRADESSKPLDVRRALRALEIMKQQGADFRILYLHWGHEYELHPTVKQMRAARALAQGGADLILGAHSHNAQPPEICQVNETRPSDLPCQLSDPANPTRRESWIFYGLGNFTTSLFGVPAQLAMLTDLTIRKKPDRTWEVRQANAQFYYNEHSLFRESDTRLIPYQTRWNALSEIERASEKTTIDQIRAIIGLREFRPNQ